MLFFHITEKNKENEQRLWKRSFALSDWQTLPTPALEEGELVN